MTSTTCDPDIVFPTFASTKYSRQPYYIHAPAYEAKNLQSRVLHELCNALNQLGFESYVDSPVVCGDLWTPMVTASVKAAHFKAKKTPILVSPHKRKGAGDDVGVQVELRLDAVDTPEKAEGFDGAVLVFDGLYRDVQGSQPLWWPVANGDVFAVPPDAPARDLQLLYMDQYTGPVTGLPEATTKITPGDDRPLSELADLYARAKVLYTYEWSVAAIEARLCGCPVVLIPNASCLPSRPAAADFYGSAGLAWGLDDDACQLAEKEVLGFAAQYRHSLSNWPQQLQAFVRTTQAAAGALAVEAAWPQTAVDALPGIYTEPADLAARADRRKWQKVNDQYKKWVERSSLREIDADIYAEMAMSGQLAPLAVLIDQRFQSTDALADTVDSLMACLGQASEVMIVSGDAAPADFAQSDTLHWIHLDGRPLHANDVRLPHDRWLLVLEAGVTLAPNALVEWAWTAQTSTTACLIYADEDVRRPDGSRVYPHFKPDANLELLRCSNYLGGAVAVKVAPWLEGGLPLFQGEMYGYALAVAQALGKNALSHVDTVLFHASNPMSADLESREFDIAKAVLTRQPWTTSLRPLSRWGTWLVEYTAPPSARVSLVVPTGLQTGYLHSMLEAVAKYPEPSLLEVILVCQPAQVDEVRLAIAGLLPDQVRVLAFAQAVYNHSAALNEGVRCASGDFIVIADDDTEPMHANWLSTLLGVMQQPDVACVAPRLLAARDADARVVGGPTILGISGASASFTGEEQRVDEVGPYARLQLTQDTSAVDGHFFVLRKADWVQVGGFDAEKFGLYCSVLDYCLRLSALGKRHVWTPLVGVMHHGGKTLGLLKRDIRQRIVLAEMEVTERENLLKTWAHQLANDPNYNRHLSLAKAFDVEADIVIDWLPKRRNRPRALAVPIHSGAGQYRVVEPMNALQDAGLAQTCVVQPLARGHHRVLQPLELVRAAPDCLILQHSVDDGQLRQIEYYKCAAPQVKIVQMVDDLFGDVPEKHPGRLFQSREGHQRMMDALLQSDKMVVTTQPLVDYYKRYVADVRIVPNALGAQWLGLRKAPVARERLRIGWVGAGQHHGDLELVTEVVRQLAPEVDWVFMGMCTDSLRPLLKEFHGFVSIADYPKKMAELCLDVAIAPLEDNLFNRCKSNLRLLEYGAMGWPVVCSDVYPYRTDDPPVIRVNNTCEEWVSAIRQMFDERTRLRYADGLHQWVQDKYLLRQHEAAWARAIFSE